MVGRDPILLPSFALVEKFVLVNPVVVSTSPLDRESLNEEATSFLPPPPRRQLRRRLAALVRDTRQFDSTFNFHG